MFLSFFLPLNGPVQVRWRPITCGPITERLSEERTDLYTDRGEGDREVDRGEGGGFPSIASFSTQ